MKRERDRAANGFEDMGGYMEAKKQKLAHQFEIEAQNSGIKEDNLFQGVAVFVNGYTEPSADELRLLMIKHGGIYHHYHRTGITTHIIASTLPDSKIKQMNNFKVVKPSWITESIKAGHILNYQDYLLLTNQSKTQPNIQKCIKNASEKGFLEEFYNNSRLHHISTLCSMFKEHITKLRSKKPYVFPGRDNLKEKADEECEDYEKPLIMHIDMDCFFVSVSVRKRPELNNKPVAVTHAKGNSKPDNPSFKKEIEAFKNKHNVANWANQLTENDSMAEIASCNYEARQKGIKNGMFVGRALKLCPDLHLINYDFEEYKDVSYTLYNTVSKYTLDIEAVSCDEMYADVTELLESSHASPMQFASLIRSEIKETTGCTCSTGFGRNKLLARLATKQAKPNGQFYLKSEGVENFLKDKNVSDLPGVGRSIAYKLKLKNVTTCGDLQKIQLSQLRKEFGSKLGEKLYNGSRGIIEEGLSFDQIRKSVSADVNYGIRFSNDEDRDIFISNLCQEVSNRLKSAGMKGKSINLKIMVRSKDAPEETAKYLGHGLCDTITKNINTSPVSSKEAIYKEVIKVFKSIKILSKDIRGIGIQITRLEAIKNETNDIMNFVNARSKKAKIINEKKLEIEHVSVKEDAEETSVPVRSSNQNEKPQEKNGVDSFVSISQIRLLIKQWVETNKQPKQKDKSMITQYLRELINTKRFEDLVLILKTFHRCIIRTDKFKEEWESALKDILDNVQTFMVTAHNSRLKIGSEFENYSQSSSLV